MDEMSDQLIADFACIDPVYVDGVAGLMNLGENFAALYFRWKMVGVGTHGKLFERQPALVLVRPTTSVGCPKCPYMVERLGVGPLRGLN